MNKRTLRRAGAAVAIPALVITLMGSKGGCSSPKDKPSSAPSALPSFDSSYNSTFPADPRTPVATADAQAGPGQASPAGTGFECHDRVVPVLTGLSVDRSVTPHVLKATAHIYCDVPPTAMTTSMVIRVATNYTGDTNPKFLRGQVQWVNAGFGGSLVIPTPDGHDFSITGPCHPDTWYYFAYHITGISGDRPPRPIVPYTFTGVPAKIAEC